jgi:DNA replication protein DnaC
MARQLDLTESMSRDQFEAETAEISRRAHIELAKKRLDNRQTALNSLLQRSAIPVRYQGASLDAPANSQALAYEFGRRFVAGFDGRLRSGAGAVLWGDVGTGKTHLACAIANAIMGQMRPVMYCTALEAVQLVKTTWRRGGDETTEFEVYERFGTPELLVIDEIGVQHGTDHERLVLTSIADIRSRNCLPTIIVSNLSPEGIYNLLGERMFDRLIGFGADVIHMPGKSLRVGWRGAT